MPDQILNLLNISKSYHQAKKSILILKNFSLEINRGDFIAVTGPSGSGKTTLLNIIGLIDRLDEGQIILNQEDITSFSSNKKNEIRKNNFGFVYQNYNLLDNFNALENVALPLILNKLNKSEANERAIEIMKLFSIENRSSHFPNALSGGEQQRVAIARALVTNPKIIIADEPTGNLDNENSSIVFNYLTNYIESEKMTLIMATHNQELAAKASRRIKL